MAKRDSALPWLLLGVGVLVVASSGSKGAPPAPSVSARRPAPGSQDFERGRANARTEHFGGPAPKPSSAMSTLRAAGQRFLDITPPGVFNIAVRGIAPEDPEDEFEYDYDLGEYLPLDDAGEEFGDFIEYETSAYDGRVNRVNPFEAVRAGPGFSIDSMQYGGS